MKATGIVRKIDDLGRLTLPKELRRTYGLNDGDPMEIMTTNEGILVKKYEPETNLLDLVEALEDQVFESRDSIQRLEDVRECLIALKQALRNEETPAVGAARESSN